jgi:hypothetical protein
MSWSDNIWLIVAVVAGYWIITSGVIQNFAMGIGGGQNMGAKTQQRPPKPRTGRNG